MAATLGLNAPSFNAGSSLTLSATTTTASIVALGAAADAYVVVVTPTAKTFYLLPGGQISSTPAPFISNWPPTVFSGPIFNYVFQGTEPVGTYTVNGFFTSPGTMTQTGLISGTSFTFTVLPTLSVVGSSVVEGNTGISSLRFTVTMSAASTGNVTVDYATANGSARSPGDYTAIAGTLTIPAGSTTGIITVPVKGDIIVESNETLRVSINNAIGATLLRASGTGTIINDDHVAPPPPPPVLPTLSVANASVPEGNVGTSNLVFTVTLSAVSATDVTVDFTTSDGTALSASDYAFQTGPLTITAGATTGTVTVIVIADTVFEPNETLTLTLSNPANATIATAAATGTITNDDVPGLNDTGITLWGNATFKNLTVTQNDGQDADHGRDAQAAAGTLVKTGAGRAGFDFTKLDAAGQPLANQAAVSVPGTPTPPWLCVQDNVTGLMWEVKNASFIGNLRQDTSTYRWYNTNAATNGGDPGVPADVNGCATGGLGNCDTELYVAAVNATNLCGFNDWRLPTMVELRSLVDYSQGAPLGFPLLHLQMIDTGYFPNTQVGCYWSQSSDAATAGAGIKKVRCVHFGSGIDQVLSKDATTNISVRVVRGGL